MAKTTSKIGDFNPDDIAVTADQHSKDIGALDDRIKKLEDKVGSNEKVADTLCEAADKAVSMRTMFSKTFCEVLKTDDSVKKAVVVLVNDSDREKYVLFLGRAGFALWTLVVIVITALVNHFIK